MAKPNVNAAGQTHDQLQAACWKSAQRIYFPFLDQRLVCIPNDMHAGNVARWKQYEALGVTPGVWDMVLHWFTQIDTYEVYNELPGQKILYPCAHWFEFKVGNDDLSNNQKKFRKRMEPIGHHFYIISEEHQFEAAIKFIVEPMLETARLIWKEEYENGKKRI